MRATGNVPCKIREQCRFPLSDGDQAAHCPSALQPQSGPCYPPYRPVENHISQGVHNTGKSCKILLIRRGELVLA